MTPTTEAVAVAAVYLMSVRREILVIHFFMHSVGHFVTLVDQDGVRHIVDLLNERQMSYDGVRTEHLKRDYEPTAITGYMDFATGDAFGGLAHPHSMGWPRLNQSTGDVSPVVIEWHWPSGDIYFFYISHGRTLVMGALFQSVLREYTTRLAPEVSRVHFNALAGRLAIALPRR